MEEEGELAREAGLARAHVAEQDDAKLLREVQSLAAENNRMNATLGLKLDAKIMYFVQRISGSMIKITGKNYL